VFLQVLHLVNEIIKRISRVLFKDRNFRGQKSIPLEVLLKSAKRESFIHA